MNRLDGRQADQLRPVTITPHFFAYAEGSTLIQIGDTRVACAVSVEDKVPPFLVGKGQGWLTAEYAMLPRATLTRSNRETKGVSGRSQEIQRLIGRSLRQVVDLKKLGERTLSVDCDVLQADGGTRTAAITGACAAVEIALQRLVSDGTLKSMPIRSRIAAVSVGIVKNSSLLDLAYLEDSKADADCNIVMTDQGDIVEIQATAEQEPFSYNRLLELIDLARKGINELLIVQKSAVAVPLLTADVAHG